MGRDQELIEAARGGNYPVVERILSTKPKKPGPFASLRRAQVIDMTDEFFPLGRKML